MSKLKTFGIWIALIAVFLFILSRNGSAPKADRATLAQFRKAIEANDVENYSFDRSSVLYRSRQSGAYYRAPLNAHGDEWTEELAQLIGRSGAKYIDKSAESEGRSEWLQFLLITVVFIAAIYFVLKRMGGGANQNIFALRNSKARLAEECHKVRFADVGGCEEARQELGDIVSFLKSPQRWQDAGARLPRGVLLEGPPGCGKTLLARAVAGETDGRFYYTSASEFVEMFIGVGPARVRDMFDTARKEAPAVIFIDELDAIGRRRGSGVGFANEEREQTLNQILVCMDGFQPTDRVVVIAATNRADILDKALVRAGRFDRRIRIDALDAPQRAEVLRIHTRSKKLSADVSLEEVANATEGLNGADLETLTNQAALLSVRRSASSGAGPGICAADFHLALQRREDQSRGFDALDAVLFEATTQLAEPTARAVAKITLVNGTVLEGDVVWVDPNFVKIRRSDTSNGANGDQGTCIIPKGQILSLEAAAGTASISVDDLQVDRGLGTSPNFA
jgi:ATP-dependent Zn protease